jgi:protein translocase SecG subunit
MTHFLFGFQIFFSILIALVVVFQKSSSDGIVSNTDHNFTSGAQTTFINRFTIFLIFIFMANSLFLARQSIKQYQNNKSIISSLENEAVVQESKEKSINVPKME